MLGASILSDTVVEPARRRLHSRTERFMAEAVQILVVEDEDDIRNLVAMNLRRAGFSVLTAADGEEALAKAAVHLPPVVLLDLMLPDIQGTEICARLRADPATAGTYVIMVTARGEEDDRLEGFEAGADDYVTKPFSTRILLARIAALLRREERRAAPGTGPVHRVLGHLSLDEERMELRYAQAQVVVTVTEFRMIEVLTERPGIVWSRERLLDRVRGDDSVVAERLVDTYVRRLRRKFEEVDPTFDHIETVVGAGYRWPGGR